ncbi:MAG: hypothetical protein ACTS27_03865 [Phycisphaerales bacterium]
MRESTAQRSVPRRAVTLAAACAWVSAHATAGDPSPWFASEVVDYSPAPGQFVNGTALNDPAAALGAPTGGAPGEPATTDVVTLGGFGGLITLKFADTVLDDPCNPFGVDAIVFGNALYVSGNPRRRFAEAAHIEVSYDANANGLADDAWFVIRGSSLPAVPSDAFRSQDWDSNPGTPTPPANTLWYPQSVPAASFTTGAFELPPMFAANIVTLPPDAEQEAVWGYADFTPTLSPPAGADPDAFYSTPDDPFAIGITPGSAGGDAFDIAWAVDPMSGAPANLPGFDFIRITTAVDAVIGPLGEISAEIAGVARVRSRVVLEGDATGDGVVNFADLNLVLSNFGVATDEGDANCDGVVNFADLNAVLSNFGAEVAP